MYRNASKNGFTLIELLVYVALLSWFSYCALQLLTHLVVVVREGGKMATESAQALLACDVLARDLRTAPCNRSDWKQMPNTYHEHAHLIWQTESGDIGWWVEKDSLLRATGTYDAQKKKWMSKRRVVTAHGIQKLRALVSVKNERVVAVTYAVELATAFTPTLEYVVALRTGPVHA